MEQHGNANIMDELRLLACCPMDMAMRYTGYTLVTLLMVLDFTPKHVKDGWELKLVCCCNN